MRVGIIGGGQLGMLLIQHGFDRNHINFIRVIDEDRNCSCSSIAHELVVGSLDDHDVLSIFAQGLDVITYETEHISVSALKKISARQPYTRFIPSIETLETIQNKASQKEFLLTKDIPIVPFTVVKDSYVISDSRKVWKASRGGYDGKGVEIVTIGQSVRQGILEDFIPHMSEFCVNVVVFSPSSERSQVCVSSFLPTKMIFHEQSNMLNYCMCSCDLPHETSQELRKIAEKCALSFNSDGLFAVEMFFLNDGTIYVNEVSPRPHNSSHHTINVLSETQNAYYALGNILQGRYFQIPAEPTEDSLLFVTEECGKHYIMKNILGPEYMKPTEYNLLALNEQIIVQSYQKSLTRPNRKIGHLTYISLDDEFHSKFGGVSLKRLVDELDNSVLVVPVNGAAVVMGSTSDWPIMKQACEALDELGVSYAKTVVSAHRTPERLRLFAQHARDSQLKCVIAGAGGAAHLPGMLAAYTELPVIGVPIRGEKSALNGVDALHSILQMPPGVPVATVAINGAKNAGILAAQILQRFDQVRYYKDMMAENVNVSANKLL